MPKSQIRMAGAGEKTQYLVHDFNDNTVRFVLHYPGRIDADILCAATKAVVDSVEVLHASFWTGHIGAYWRINEDYEESSYFCLIETKEEPMTAAHEIALEAVDPGNSTQLKCSLVRNESESVIVLNISHLCVDGVDGKYILYKLVEAYGMILCCGTAEGLVVKDGSRAPKQAYQGLGKKEYFSLLKNPIPGVKTTFPYPTENAGARRLLKANIPAAVMDEARRKAKAEGATANDILLTACFHAYASLSGKNSRDPVSIMSMMDLRRHCKTGDSEGLCNITGSLSATLQHGIEESFEETLKQVAAQTRAFKENPLAGLEGIPLLYHVTQSLPVGVLLKMIGKIYGSFSMGLTNLGNISCESLELGDLKPDDGLFGGPLKKKPGMQISVVSFDGACKLCIVGEYTKEDSILLRTMLDRMVEEIVKYAEAFEEMND